MRKIMQRDPKAVKKSNLSPRTYLLQLYAECLNVINGRFGRNEDPPRSPLPRTGLETGVVQPGTMGPAARGARIGWRLTAAAP